MLPSLLLIVRFRMQVAATEVLESLIIATMLRKARNR
jgi:hypothetical protein